MSVWNPWHGCRKISPGCLNCYVYRRDALVGKDARIVTRTGDYDLPMKRDREKKLKLLPEGGTVFTCLTSDFLIEEADAWREECWRMIRMRTDLHFAIITKRISRFMECIPSDWGEGYENVTVYCTVEDQKRADERLPLFLQLPIRHKRICQEPMLEPIEIRSYLSTGKIEQVLCGGESGDGARPLRYEWVLDTRQQCMEKNTAFYFKQTGAVFVMNGKCFRIERRFQESQARRAGIDYEPVGTPEGEEADKIQETNPMSRVEWLKTDLFERIRSSKFRSRFRLNAQERAYVKEKGTETIRRHAEDFVEKRLAPACPPNDGKQTPMRGHPVFKAQHSCGCCCRGCLEKWHGIEAGTRLSGEQKAYIVDVLMEWIQRQMDTTSESN